ncbi:type I-B CRISPR-associated endonuclease Cas1b [uncultured Ilyobacter sp.]|uniref:type I-B CRISPR-associated endonuclease Cas1b n=1 Tax=uncultured Ilyobacter sp. TaxID=544433 RepID=UPI0029F5A30E|nr:type I-B CRISPR-associated endonuclease Cas1b [uncultured Ilyobacter sp.]
MSDMSYYLLKSGELKRKDNNITMLAGDGVKKDLKIEATRDIYIFNEVTMNTKILNYLGQNSIPMHIFNYYGFYSGSFYPRESLISGDLLVKQVDHYKDPEKRIEIAKEILKAASYNIHRNLRYYKERGRKIGDKIEEVDYFRQRMDSCLDVQELMGIEGNVRRAYYSAWNDIVNQEINFEKRVKRPPDNMINTLISFVNTLIYTTVLTELYKTQLNPTISFLHETGTRRFSLSLDIAEIFKPLIGDRLIFSLLNRNEISEKDFEKESNFYYLKDKGRLKILKEYDERLNATINHKGLKRKVSYRHLIRLEAYKLIKHINGEKPYNGFKIWW